MGKFFKLAVGPVIRQTPLENSQALYYKPKDLKAMSANSIFKRELEKLPKKWKTEGLILFNNVPAKDQGYVKGKDIDRLFRRHELTHYLRYKQGKAVHVGKPHLKGIIHTAIEEIAAHHAGLKRLNAPKFNKIMGIIMNTYHSTKYMYPKGIVRTLFTKGK